MSTLKVTNAEISSERHSKGTFIEFLSTENVAKGDLFKIQLDDRFHKFEATDIKIEGENLNVKAKETAYWATRLDRKTNFDLRTIIGVEVIKITDEEEIKKIRVSATYC